MLNVADYVSAYIHNTENMIQRVFKTGPGFAIAVLLRPEADQDPQDEPIHLQYPQIDWEGTKVPVDANLFGQGATRASVETDIKNLKRDESTEEKADEMQELLDALLLFVDFSADLALFAVDYNNAAVVHFLNNPNDPEARTAIDLAAERALYLFPEINGEITPVRWRFPEREGSFVVNDNELNKAGTAQIPTPLGNDYIRTDLSREAINGQIVGLARLHEAHPDPAVKQRCAAAISAVLENLSRHDFDQYVDPFGYVVDYSVTTAARRLLPRIFTPLIPDSDQLEALKGGDKLMVYTMLRAGVLVDPTRWATIAANFFRDFESAFSFTTISLYYKFYTLTRSKSAKYASFLGLGGLVGGIAGFALGGALALVGLPFLPAAMLGVLAGVGGAVHILMNRKVEIARFESVYESIQLEQRMDAFLLEHEDPANQPARELWQNKLAQCYVLQIKKGDALTSGYFVDSVLGRELLRVDLAELDSQLATVRRLLRKAKKRWCRLLTSRRARRKYQRYKSLYDSLRVYRRLSWSTKHSATNRIPQRIVVVNYAHHYSREPEEYNQGGSLGGVTNKVSTLNDRLASTGGLELGTAEIGQEIITALDIPVAPIRTTKALTDEGLDQIQFRFLPEAFLWAHRRSVTKHPPYPFLPGAGRRFYQPGEAVLAYRFLQRVGAAQ